MGRGWKLIVTGSVLILSRESEHSKIEILIMHCIWSKADKRKKWALVREEWDS